MNDRIYEILNGFKIFDGVYKKEKPSLVIEDHEFTPVNLCRFGWQKYSKKLSRSISDICDLFL